MISGKIIPISIQNRLDCIENLFQPPDMYPNIARQLGVETRSKDIPLPHSYYILLGRLPVFGSVWAWRLLLWSLVYTHDLHRPFLILRGRPGCC